MDSFLRGNDYIQHLAHDIHHIPSVYVFSATFFHLFFNLLQDFIKLLSYNTVDFQ